MVLAPALKNRPRLVLATCQVRSENAALCVACGTKAPLVRPVKERRSSESRYGPEEKRVLRHSPLICHLKRLTKQHTHAQGACTRGIGL